MCVDSSFSCSSYSISSFLFQNLSALSSNAILCDVDKMGFPQVPHLMVAVCVLFTVFLTDVIPYLASAGRDLTTTRKHAYTSIEQVIYQFPTIPSSKISLSAPKVSPLLGRLLLHAYLLALMIWC